MAGLCERLLEGGGADPTAADAVCLRRDVTTLRTKVVKCWSNTGQILVKYCLRRRDVATLRSKVVKYWSNTG